MPLLLVAMPLLLVASGAPSSVLAPSSDALVTIHSKHPQLQLRWNWAPRLVGPTWIWIFGPWHGRPSLFLHIRATRPLTSSFKLNMHVIALCFHQPPDMIDIALRWTCSSSPAEVLLISRTWRTSQTLGEKRRGNLGKV